MSTEKLLEERGDRYGEYFDNARTMQALKRALRTGVHWNEAPDIVKEALEMLCLKMGRIVNGDPLYDDNWRDCLGYVQLVIDRLDSVKQPGEIEADPFAILAQRYGMTRADAKRAFLGTMYNDKEPDDRTPIRAQAPEPTAASIPFPTSPAFITGMTHFPTTKQDGHNRARTVDPMPAGPPGTEPKDASHAAEPMVPRHSVKGIHLTNDHVGMFFRLAGENTSPVRLQPNDGPEYGKYPFKAAGKRYTEYGFCAAADGDPIHDIVAFHPH